MKTMIDKLKQEIKNKTVVEQLLFLSEKFKDKIVFSTSFGQEDQVITDLILKNNIPIKVFSLDTGRLFEETYKVYNKTLEKYNNKIKIYNPNTEKVEKLLSEKGPYSFYESTENRKECCGIRKVEPLKRALSGNACWITGLRAEQSTARNELEFFEWDENFKIIKFNVLKDWTLADINDYLVKYNVPYNSLHDKGFISIGCSPCTRAIKKGEDIRAGRWWWEDNSKKECGLHETTKTEENLLIIKTSFRIEQAAKEE